MGEKKWLEIFKRLDYGSIFYVYQIFLINFVLIGFKIREWEEKKGIF